MLKRLEHQCKDCDQQLNIRTKLEYLAIEAWLRFCPFSTQNLSQQIIFGKLSILISHLLQQIVVKKGVPLPPVSEDDQEVGGIPVKSPKHHLLPIWPEQHVRRLLRVLLQVPGQVAHQHCWEDRHLYIVFIL